MTLFDALTFFRGSCEFSVGGTFPERFLNLAARANLGLWDVARDGDRLSARIVAAKYKKTLPLARKCGVRLRIRRKQGLPFYLLPHRKRSGMALGFCLFWGVIWLLSNFIWFIDLPETTPEITAAITATLEDAGIAPGALRSRISGKEAANDLQLSIPELSWAGVSVFGSWMTIDIRELNPPKILLSDETPCNVVAAKAGVVTAFEAFDGAVAIAVGQPVAAGDLLISGLIDHESGDVTIVHAWGNVWARTEYTIVSEIPLQQIRQEHTGKRITLRRLMVLGIEIPLSFGGAPEGTFERKHEVWQPHIGKTGMPLMLRSEYWFELRPTHREISYDEAEAMAREDARKQILAQGEMEMTSYNEVLELTDSGVRLTIYIIALENIATQEKITFAP